MRKTVNLWRGLIAVFGALLLLVSFGAQVANDNAPMINAFLGLRSSMLVNTDPDDVAPQYYESEFIEDINNPTMTELNSLKSVADRFVEQEMEEGAVLLKNKNNALPLAASERKVTLFGHATFSPLYKPFSGGGLMDYDRHMSLKMALTAGPAAADKFDINETVWNEYASRPKSEWRGGRHYYSDGGSGDANKTYNIGEPTDQAFYDSLATKIGTYKDAAIIMIARSGGEFRDLPTGLAYNDVGGAFPNSPEDASLSYLELHPSEKKMLNVVKNGGFGKIILLVNSPYAMELDWADSDSYGIDSVLWVGCPGLRGFVGVKNILVGNVNPSGRLVDTFATNSRSSPAVQNFGANRYTNYSAINSYCKDNDEFVDFYLVYQEGIYVGYKYYETRYEDIILGQGDAAGTFGKWASTGNWDYSQEVLYPFGYGLSYTNFTQKIVGTPSFNAGTRKYSVSVEVQNTGNRTGKSVVELYVQTPYGVYEKNSAVEKSAIQLAGFAKTDKLDPGAKQTVTVTVDQYLLTSYDYTIAKGYILSAGNYHFAIGDNAHDALNNVLAKKGATGMKNVDGTPYSVPSSIAEKVWTWAGPSGAPDTTTYRYSIVGNGREVTNQLEFMDVNTWLPDGQKIQYLTRQDWKGSYPKPQLISATEEMMKELDGYFYKKPADAPSVSDFKIGNASETPRLKFIDMRGVSYDDDETWNEFLNQLTIDEMTHVMLDQLGNEALPRIGKPYQDNDDGPDGLQASYALDGKDCTGYVAEVVSASTWNTEMHKRKGQLMGEEAFFAKTSQLWSPGANMHRTPFGGRNFEYYSECSIMAYLCLAAEAPEMQKKGLNVAVKHLAGNDQEYQRRGVSTFMTEQTFREVGLKAFEAAFTIGKAQGTMTAYNRLGLKYAGASSEMQEEILRGEWGFKGAVITDCSTAGSMDKGLNYIHTIESLVNGSDMFCMEAQQYRANHVKDAINDGDGYVLLKLREANKHFYYSFANSNLAVGLTRNTIIVPIKVWWVKLLDGILIGSGIITAASLAMYVTSMVLVRKKCT